MSRPAAAAVDPALHPPTSDVTPVLFADRKPGPGVGQLRTAACRRCSLVGVGCRDPIVCDGAGSGSGKGRDRTGTSAPTRTGTGTEVLRRDLVEELAELLDLVLLLVGDLDPHLVEQLLGPEDGGTGADGEGDGVGRAGAHDPVVGEEELGEVDAIEHP